MSILSWDDWRTRNTLPLCGTVQDELSQPVSIEPNEGVQTDLLDENNEPTPSFTTKVETSIPEEDNNRSSQENRVKNNRLAYSGAWNKFKRFFTSLENV